MSRTPLRSIALAAVALLVLGACSSDTKQLSPATTVDTSAATAATVDTSAATAESTDNTTSGEALLVDTVPGGSDAGERNPQISALSALSGDAVCQLVPAADVSKILGIDAGEPDGRSIPGLSSGCGYLVQADDGSLVSASIAFAAFDWKTQAYAKTSIDPPATTCIVGGLDAFCQDAYTDTGTDFDASVLVKLGSVVDNTLEADAPSLAQAMAMAQLALSNLKLG
jgi:hypothetical protein